jgi:hypothetical protein
MVYVLGERARLVLAEVHVLRKRHGKRATSVPAEVLVALDNFPA